MAFKNFKDIEEYILSNGIVKTVALACAQDEIALTSLVAAKRRGVVKGILIGNLDSITEILSRLEEPVEDYQLIECLDEMEAGRLAVSLVKEGKADIPMKGLMMTSSFMKAILNKEEGFLKEGDLLSQATVLEYKAEERLQIIADCAVNIAPTLEEKKKITQNCIDLAHRIGIDKPNIAFLSAIEKVNPKMPSTVDADALANWDGFIGAGELAGPLALDITISKEAAEHKGVNNAVCGNADILIVPSIEAGNIFTKALTFYAGLNSAATLNGTSHPVIMTSRTDTPEDKYYSILIAILKCLD